jgi:ATP-dependent DNA ligase
MAKHFSVSFQLATACPEPPTGDGWTYEVKHDGHRTGVIRDGVIRSIIERRTRCKIVRL